MLNGNFLKKKIPTISEKSLIVNMNKLIKTATQIYKSQKAVKDFVSNKAQQAIDIKDSVTKIHEQVKKNNFVDVYKELLVSELLNNLESQILLGEVWKMLSIEQQSKMKQEWKSIIQTCYLVTKESVPEKESNGKST